RLDAEPVDHVAAARHPPCHRARKTLVRQAGYRAVERDDAVVDTDLDPPLPTIGLARPHDFVRVADALRYRAVVEGALLRERVLDVSRDLAVAHPFGRLHAQSIDDSGDLGERRRALQRDPFRCDVLDLAGQRRRAAVELHADGAAVQIDLRLLLESTFDALDDFGRIHRYPGSAKAVELIWA